MITEFDNEQLQHNFDVRLTNINQHLNMVLETFGEIIAYEGLEKKDLDIIIEQIYNVRKIKEAII